MKIWSKALLTAPEEEQQVISAFYGSGAVKGFKCSEDFSKVYMNSKIGEETKTGYLRVYVPNISLYEVSLVSEKTGENVSFNTNGTVHSYNFSFIADNYPVGIYYFKGFVRKKGSIKILQTFTLTYYRVDYIDTITVATNRTELIDKADDYTWIKAKNIASGTGTVYVGMDTTNNCLVSSENSKLAAIDRGVGSESFYIYLYPNKLTIGQTIEEEVYVYSRSSVEDGKVIDNSEPLKTVRVIYTRTV